MIDIYNNGTYLRNNPTWDAEDATVKANNIVEIIERNKLSFSSIGEVGCGSGEIIVQLNKKLQEVENFYGFDISNDAINIAREKETNKIKFELKDVAKKEGNIPFFDLILVIDVIEHVENYFSFIDGIANKSKYTIFHIPLDMSVWTLFKEKILIDSKNRVGHIHNFTEDFIKHILSNYGYIIIDQIYTKPTFGKFTFKQRVFNILRKFVYKINKKFSTKFFGGYSIMLLAKNP